MPQIKLIIFDFWQTLADSEIKPSELFDSLMLPGKIDTIDFVNKLSQSDIYLNNMTLEDSIKLLLSNLYKNTDKFILEKAISLWKEMAKKAFLIRGATELLLNLKTRGYTLCLLTNIDKYGYEHFPDKKIFINFDYQFLSYSTGVAKPNLKCWSIIKENHKIDYNEMMMIGDSYENDILPAQTLGINTVQIVSNKSMYSDIMCHPLLGK